MRVDSYMAGFALVIGSVLVSILGLLLVRRRIDARILKACHEVGGYLLSVVGTLYAVLLGLIVVDAMSVFQEAHQTTEQEANALADLVLLAKQLPEGRRREMIRLASRYADLVIDREWEEMDRGQCSAEARHAALELIDAAFRCEPHSESEQALHDARVAAALQLWNSRRCRIELSARGIPALKWYVLILGGVITIFFTFFFIVESLKIQALMTALITVSIALNIFLVAMFGYPYSGDLRVDPSCYRAAQEIASDLQGPPPCPPPSPIGRAAGVRRR
ncbi:MAG: DUF4239 domain-containing protein [Isosphaeraceae bacterium]|nr:DUF4239 domain-containing protein [Isosphaeraceae bacterium]